MTTPQDDGGPAFPIPGIPPVGTGDPRDGMAGGCDPQSGMSLRDWFAGMALQGYLAGRNNCRDENPDNFQALKACRDCYGYADAMLAARKESK